MLTGEEIERGMDLLVAVHEHDEARIRRFRARREWPRALRGKRPMWQVMGDLAEAVVTSVATLRDQLDPASLEMLPALNEGSTEKQLAAVFGTSLRELGHAGGPGTTVPLARATLRYLGVVAPGRVETWLDCLRTALNEQRLGS